MFVAFLVDDNLYYDMPRLARGVALGTYHGASTIILRILDWLLWIIDILDLLAQPHNSRPYVQIGVIKWKVYRNNMAHTGLTMGRSTQGTSLCQDWNHTCTVWYTLIYKRCVSQVHKTFWVFTLDRTGKDGEDEGLEVKCPYLSRYLISFGSSRRLQETVSTAGTVRIYLPFP
jgi:hypothetical protein